MKWKNGEWKINAIKIKLISNKKHCQLNNYFKKTEKNKDNENSSDIHLKEQYLYHEELFWY